MTEDMYDDFLKSAIRVETDNVNYDPTSVWAAGRLSAFKSARVEYLATKEQSAGKKESA